MTPALSDRGTLLVPVPHEALELRSVMLIGDVVLVPKAEHHITVFGFRIGKLLLAAMAGEPELRQRIESHIGNVVWNWRRSGFFFTLERDLPKPLTTVIELVDAPIAKFYSAVAGEVDAARWPELAAALASPPQPHVTLYTSDKKGVDGIGLDRSEDLKAALVAERSSKLRAYALAHPSLSREAR